MESVVRSWGMTFKGKKIWIPDIKYNQIVSYNVENNEVKRETVFKCHSPLKAAMFSDIVQDNNNFICVPMSSDYIGVYDYITNTNEEIPIDGMKIPHSRFFTAVNVHGHIFMIPVRYPGIIEYYNGTITYHTSWLKQWKQKYKEDHIEYFRNAALIDDKYLAMASQQSNQVLLFNVKDKTYNFYEIGDNDDTFWEIVYDGIDCWITTRTGGKVIRWNPRSQKQTYYEKFPNECGDCSYEPFSGMVDLGQYMLLFQRNASCSIKIEKATGKIVVIGKLNENPYLDFDEKQQYINGYWIDDTKIIIPSDTKDGSIAIYDWRTEQIQWIQVKIEVEELFIERMKEESADQKYIMEGKGYLKCFLENLDLLVESNESNRVRKSVGEQIFERVMK